MSSSNPPARIAFLGLGIMGGGMTRRLLAAGFPLSVYNRDPAKSAALGTAGARVARTPREAAAGAEIVFCMVADDSASRAMWLGPDGALAGAPKAAVLVECSTLTVSWIKELAQTVAAHGGEFVDAPVTGSKLAAAGGELNFLVGGRAESLAKIRPALMAMGRSVSHLGPTGSGAFVKLVNNFMSGVHAAAFAEALAWIERSGVDRAAAVAVLLDGAAGSPMAKVMAGRMTTNNFAPNFLLRLMAKDLSYAMGEAEKSAVHLETATAALKQFQAAIDAGHGEKDMSAVVESVRAKR